MIFTAGIDVGSTYTKALILSEDLRIAGQAMKSTGFKLAETSRQAYQSALDDAVAWAPTCPSAARLVATQKISAQSLNDFIASPAFRNRVLDRWLTFKGGATNW